MKSIKKKVQGQFKSANSDPKMYLIHKSATIIEFSILDVNCGERLETDWTFGYGLISYDNYTYRHIKI